MECLFSTTSLPRGHSAGSSNRPNVPPRLLTFCLASTLSSGTLMTLLHLSSSRCGSSKLPHDTSTWTSAPGPGTAMTVGCLGDVEDSAACCSFLVLVLLCPNKSRKLRFWSNATVFRGPLVAGVSLFLLGRWLHGSDLLCRRAPRNNAYAAPRGCDAMMPQSGNGTKLGVPSSVCHVISAASFRMDTLHHTHQCARAQPQRALPASTQASASRVVPLAPGPGPGVRGERGGRGSTLKRRQRRLPQRQGIRATAAGRLNQLLRRHH